MLPIIASTTSHMSTSLLIESALPGRGGGVCVREALCPPPCLAQPRRRRPAPRATPETGLLRFAPATELVRPPNVARLRPAFVRRRERDSISALAGRHLTARGSNQTYGVARACASAWSCRSREARPTRP